MKKFVIYSRQKCHEKRRKLYTYHVCSRNPNDKKSYSIEMIEQMKKYLNNDMA